MTPEEAYIRGQEDMRRRICKRLRGWYFGGDLVQAMKRYSDYKRSRVDVAMRMLKIRALKHKDT